MTNLRAAGYAPGEVDDILLTHLHADHVGGLMRNGQATFPNATVHVSRRDADYWLDPAEEARAPFFLRPMFEGARKVLAPYVAADRLRRFDYGREVLPGIKPVATPGHTPGHSSYLIGSGPETLVIWGDIVHVAPLQFPDPSIPGSGGQDSVLDERGAATHHHKRRGAETQRQVRRPQGWVLRDALGV